MPRDNYGKDTGRRHTGRNRPHGEKTLPQCPICNKPIRDISTAISSREKKDLSHFDCVLLELRKREELQPNEKICYLGRGSFGIISFRSSGGPIRFLIRKRIQYEDRDHTPEWQNKSN